MRFDAQKFLKDCFRPSALTIGVPRNRHMKGPGVEQPDPDRATLALSYLTAYNPHQGVAYTPNCGLHKRHQVVSDDDGESGSEQAYNLGSSYRLYRIICRMPCQHRGTQQQQERRKERLTESPVS